MLPSGVFRHGVNGPRAGADFDVAPDAGVIGHDAVLIAQHSRDEPITFAPTPPIANQVRERFQLALIRVASCRGGDFAHPSIKAEGWLLPLESGYRVGLDRLGLMMADRLRGSGTNTELV